MKTLMPLFCLLAITVFMFGCSGDEGPVTEGNVSSAVLITGDNPTNQIDGGDSPPAFYTIHWAVENDWATGMERIDLRSGKGTHLFLFDIDPDPQNPDAFYTPYGIAFDVDGTCYTTVNWFDGVEEHSSSRLATIDMETGALTYIGDPYPINFAGPEMDDCGNIYSTGFTVGDPETGGEPPFVFGDSYLYRIDKNTGEATQIGDTGHTEWMDLDFDSQGRLWGSFSNKLYTIDTGTGASTFVTDIIGVPQVNVPGVCPQDWPWMEVMSIAFDKKNVLWATAMRGFSWCDDNDAPVMTVDVNTGVATVIGYTNQGYNHGGDIMPSKVTVCHRTGNRGYVSIDVSLAALDEHLAHGDKVPGDFPNCGCPGDAPDMKQ